MSGGTAGAIASLTTQQRMAMAWWVFFGQCECIDCCRMRHAWHAARLMPSPPQPEVGHKRGQGEGGEGED